MIIFHDFNILIITFINHSILSMPSVYSRTPHSQLLSLLTPLLPSLSLYPFLTECSIIDDLRVERVENTHTHTLLFTLQDYPYLTQSTQLIIYSLLINKILYIKNCSFISTGKQ